ncbi:unnamed protein product [Blepharisma stoltei]|uniref:Uncharacterized protein n=1 Tax=Blepharisma stoltei TaxID=1481888 RepID=A0AAU9JQ15_9CILI|nr:unnamed protein product [Blepharisma stoltei]
MNLHTCCKITVNFAPTKVTVILFFTNFPWKNNNIRRKKIFKSVNWIYNIIKFFAIFAWKHNIQKKVWNR